MEPCCDHLTPANAYARKVGFMYQLNNTCAFMEIGHCFHDEASVKANIKKAWQEGRGGIIGTLTTNQKTEREVAKKCGFVEIAEVKNDYFGHHTDKYKVGLFFLDLKQPGHAKMGSEVFWLFKNDLKHPVVVPAPVVAPVPVVAPPPPPIPQVMANNHQQDYQFFPPLVGGIYAQPAANNFGQVQVPQPDAGGIKIPELKAPKVKTRLRLGFIPGGPRRYGKKSQVPKV